MIHPTAIIERGAQIGLNVDIGAYALIESNTIIGNNTTIKSHAILREYTEIGQSCTVDSFAIIGGDPQDISFDRDVPSGVIVNSGTIIREHVTIHRSTQENGRTNIGENCYLMAGAHVGHDCVIGNNVILANCSLLGGVAKVDDRCFIGGGASIHQHVHIGEQVILGGYSATSLDLPPYIMSADRSSVVGLNIVGLTRANFSIEQISELKKCFKAVYNTTGNYREIAEQIMASQKLKFPESEKFLKYFISPSERGVAPLRRKRKLR